MPYIVIKCEFLEKKFNYKKVKSNWTIEKLQLKRVLKWRRMKIEYQLRLIRQRNFHPDFVTKKHIQRQHPYWFHQVDQVWPKSKNSNIYSPLPYKEKKIKWYATDKSKLVRAMLANNLSISGSLAKISYRTVISGANPTRNDEHNPHLLSDLLTIKKQ